MSRYEKTIHAFADESLDDYLRERLATLEAQIAREAEAAIETADEDEYVNRMVLFGTPPAPVIEFEGMTRSSYETEVPAERLRGRAVVREGNAYRRPVVVFHLPLQEDPALLAYRPNPAAMCHPELHLNPGELCLEYVMLSDDTEPTKQQLEADLACLRQNYGHMHKQLEEYAEELRRRVVRAFRGRKQELLDRRKVLEGFGVPPKQPGA